MGDLDLASIAGAGGLAAPIVGFVVLVTLALKFAGAGRREAVETDARLDKAQKDLDAERQRRREVEDQMSALRDSNAELSRKVAELTRQVAALRAEYRAGQQ